MASLNTLRTKGGVIVTIVIFVALLAFLIGDVFTSGSSLMNSRKMRVGEIDGKTVGYVDFLNKSDEISNIYKMMWGRDAFSAEEQEMIYNMAWQQFIMQDAYQPGFQKLGMTVAAAEQVDMVNGAYLSPVITSTFANPATGEFDAQFLKAFLANVNNNDGSFALWSFLRSQMAQERIMSKYISLVEGGFFANDLEIAHGLKAANETYAADVIGREYYTVPDSLVKVTPAQVKAYYDANKEAFRQEASRDIEYVVFDVLPSEADYADAQEVVNDIAAEFAVSDAPMQYALLNSQTKPDQTYYRPDQLDAAVAALDGDRTKMAGPTLNGDEYTMARIADVRMLPDTLGAQHILLQKGQNALADSLVNVLRGGADFAALAAQYSLDQYSEGGDLGRFTPAQLPMAFTDAAMNAKVGDIYTVESDAGLQVVKLTYKTRPVRKMQVATVTYKIDPSAATIQEAYQKASNFVTAAAGTAEGFAQAVGDQMLSKRTVRIRTTDRAINGLENSKEIVRWAFNGKTGDVSQIMDIDGNYYVAALTGVREKGYATVEQATADITKTLMNQEKARILAAEMTGATLEEVAAATGEQIRKAENVEWNAFYIPEIGVEPQFVYHSVAWNRNFDMFIVRTCDGKLIFVDSFKRIHAEFHRGKEISNTLLCRCFFFDYLLRFLRVLIVPSGPLHKPLEDAISQFKTHGAICIDFRAQAFHKIGIVVAGVELYELHLLLLFICKQGVVVEITIADDIGGNFSCKIRFSCSRRTTEDNVFRFNQLIRVRIAVTVERFLWRQRLFIGGSYGLRFFFLLFFTICKHKPIAWLAKALEALLYKHDSRENVPAVDHKFALIVIAVNQILD